MSTYHSPHPAPVRPDPARPEQTFFTDPAIDRLLGVVMNLATEVFVIRERCAAQEAMLLRAGLLDGAGLTAEPSQEEIRARDATQRAFVQALLEPLRGLQATRGASR